MPHWNLKIDLAPEVKQWKDGEVSVEELARAVKSKIDKSGWRAFTPYPHTFDDHLGRLLQAETASQYEAAFEYIYDLADEDRVWIDTN